MPTQTNYLSRPYPVENTLNVFGDYDTLLCVLTRDLEKPLETKEEWYLRGPAGVLELDEAATLQALKALFFNQARQRQ